MPLGYSGDIVTCSGYGWPPPSIEWVRNGTSLGRNPTGQNQAFVSARLRLAEVEGFGQSHVGDYSCILRAGDGTNQTYTKVVTLTSSNSFEATPTEPALCTSKSPQANFQIRVLDTQCDDWEDSLLERIARDFQNEMLNVIITECPNCAATATSVTILGKPTCSSVLPGAAVFRGSITTGGADTTEDIFCTLDAWYRAGPLLQVNNELHLVDQNCTLALDQSTFAECTVSPITVETLPVYIIAWAAGGGAVLLLVVILCVIVTIFCFHSRAKKKETIRVGKVRMNSSYEG